MLDEFNRALRSPDPYYLCLGNPQILTVESEHARLLDLPAYYISFPETPYGYAYCYSLLENCQGVFLLSDWANIATVITAQHLTCWRRVLDELLMIGCLVIMVEMPLSQKHFRHPKSGGRISLRLLKQRRARYIRELIEPINYPEFLYTDLAAIIGYDSHYLTTEQVNSKPWRLTSTAVKRITRYFVKVCIAGCDRGNFLNL